MMILLFKDGNKIKITEEHASIITEEMHLKGHEEMFVIIEKKQDGLSIMDENNNTEKALMVNIKDISAIYRNENII